MGCLYASKPNGTVYVDQACDAPSDQQQTIDREYRVHRGLWSNPRQPAYCASKGGLRALTRAIAVDHDRMSKLSLP
jgi:NAD(P)-dependent dehydrogenase (short-subunit alcohol dehydrogenase family)